MPGWAKQVTNYLTPATWILALGATVLFAYGAQQLMDTQRRLQEAADGAMTALVRKLKAIPRGTLTVPLPTLATVEKGSVAPVAGAKLCQWLDVVDDRLEIEDAEKWRRRPDPEYVVAHIPDGERCPTRAPDRLVYVLVKQTIAPNESARDLELEIEGKGTLWRFGVTTSRTKEGQLRYNTYSRNNATGSREQSNFEFFKYVHANTDEGATPVFFRLVLPIDANALDALSTLRARVSIATSLDTRYERVIRAVVRPEGGKKLRRATTVKDQLGNHLLPCEGVEVSDARRAISQSRGCTERQRSLSGPMERVLTRLITPALPSRERTFTDSGLTFRAWTSGEPQVLELLPEVRKIAATVGLGLLLLLCANFLSMRSLRRRVKRLASRMHSALASGENVEFPDIEDHDLGVLAHAASEAVQAIARERQLAAKVLQEQTIEQERARAFEDRTYVITHELRNFVGSVSINVTTDPVIRDKAWLAERMLEEVSRIANRESWKPEFLTAPRPTTLLQVFEDWWSKKSDAQRTELILADHFRAQAEVAVSCVPSLVLQILDKFLENALEHRQDRQPIVVATEFEAAFAGISLTNRHEDIDAERAAALFRPAPRADASRMRGFGLLAAREYALAAGGFVSAVSRYPNVAFCVFLPRIDTLLSKDSAGLPPDPPRHEDTVATA